MSQKRKHTELSSADPDRDLASKKPRGGPKPGYAPHKKAFKHKSSSDGPSTGALKSRIRDLRRLLDHADSDPTYKFPANIRIERERELEACEHELQEKQAAAREAEFRRKMIGKYHQVRFFDRQKATRLLKKLRRALESAEDETKKAALERKIHVAEVDLNYAQYYPLLKPYASLFPRSKREATQSEEPGSEGADAGTKEEESGPKGDNQMWKQIEGAMKEGQHALDRLRNWKPERENSKDKRKEAQTKSDDKKKKNKKENVEKKVKEKRSKKIEDEEEDSDGGFFE